MKIFKLQKKEYDNLNKGNPVTINNGEVIGYVSEIIDNKITGEQAYIVTDGNPQKQKAKDVKNVTVLYRGLSATATQSIVIR